MTRTDLEPGNIFVIRAFLTPEECAAEIERSEGIGFEPAPLGTDRVADLRSNDRVILDDERRPAELFHRARPLLPEPIGKEVLVGFNERLRYYRYDPGQSFQPHRDGSYLRFPQCERSHFPFIIYLNDDVEGGQTRFFQDVFHATRRRPYVSVEPARGTALVFGQGVWQDGAPVLEGRKYVLRTDVMYGRPRKTAPEGS